MTKLKKNNHNVTHNSTKAVVVNVSLAFQGVNSKKLNLEDLLVLAEANG